MSKRRMIPLPLKGIDARASTAVDPQTMSYSENMRSYNQDLQHLTTNTYVPMPSPSSNTQVARNIVQFFMSPPGGPDQNRLLMSTNSGVWIANTALTSWTAFDSFNLTGIPVVGGTTYPRLAMANSGHKMMWTSTRAGTPVAVRVYDGTTLTIISPAYAADHLIAFNHRCVIANTLESGTRNAARVRWSANRNFTDWSGTGSGFMEVGSNQSSGSIRALVEYDELALISLENEVIELVPTNSLFPVFEEGNHYVGTPIVSSQTWQVINHVAYFLGPDSVYAWDHSKFYPIGRPIEPITKQWWDPARAITLQAIGYPARNEYHLLHNEGARTGTSGAGLLVYDINADRWFADSVPGGSISAIGKVTTLYQDTAYVRNGGVAPPQEFSLRTNGFDTVGFEERQTSWPSSNPAGGIVVTQDIYALTTDDQQTQDAKNECLALYFITLPNQQVIVDYQLDGVTGFVNPVTVTANNIGLAKYSVQVAFMRIRFRFRSNNNYLYLTGNLEMEYEFMGETY